MGFAGEKSEKNMLSLFQSIKSEKKNNFYRRVIFQDFRPWAPMMHQCQHVLRILPSVGHKNLLRIIFSSWFWTCVGPKSAKIIFFWPKSTKYFQSCDHAACGSLRNARGGLQRNRTLWELFLSCFSTQKTLGYFFGEFFSLRYGHIK